jgi:hypothetical protein
MFTFAKQEISLGLLASVRQNVHFVGRQGQRGLLEQCPDLSLAV